MQMLNDHCCDHCREPLHGDAWVVWNPDSLTWDFDGFIGDYLYCLKCGAEYYYPQPANREVLK